MWVDEDDGEWMAPGYYDSELGVDCAPRSWTAERCLPTATALRYDEDRLFADERCTEPAVRLTSFAASGCRIIEHVWRGRCADATGTINPPSSSSEPAGLYRFGEPLAGPLYERDEATGACVPRPFRDGASLFRLEPADLDALAVVHRVLG